jgi:hypothetical protein
MCCPDPRRAAALLLIAFLAACTLYANADIRRLIALRREARASACIAQALSVTAFTSAVVLCTLPDTSLLRVLTLQTTEAASVSACA